MNAGFCAQELGGDANRVFPLHLARADGFGEHVAGHHLGEAGRRHALVCGVLGDDLAGVGVDQDPGLGGDRWRGGDDGLRGSRRGGRCIGRGLRHAGQRGQQEGEDTGEDESDHVSSG